MNDNVDFRVPAELFPGTGPHRSRQRYRRFDTLAEAVLYAHDHLSGPELAGAFIEADEVRYGGAEIASLYAAASHPIRG